MTDSPLVSIVIPVYNGSNYLAEAIESALSQTHKNIEVIVVNDGSVDNHATRDVAMKYEDQIRYFEKENGGVSSALNLGITKMRGDYFNWLSHDDLFDPTKVEAQLEFMRLNALSVSYSDYRNIDQNGKTINEIESPYYHRLEAMKRLIGSGFIHGCTVMIRKELFKKLGMFNEKLKYTQDIDMWFRILKVEDLKKISKVLISSRIHQNQTSSLNNSAHKKEIFKFYKNALHEPLLQNFIFNTEIAKNIDGYDDPIKLSKLYDWLGDKLMFKMKDYSGAVYFFEQSKLVNPNHDIKQKMKLVRAQLSMQVFEKAIGNLKSYLRSFPIISRVYSIFK